MVNMNAEAVEFEISRLQGCCSAYRAEIASLKAWIRKWHDDRSTPVSPLMEAREAANIAEATNKALQDELQRISFASGNIAIEHPEWPPEYAKHLTAMQLRNKALVEALRSSVNILETLTSERLEGKKLSILAAFHDDRDRIAQASITRSRKALGDTA